ncbi:MAG: hypothetical protein RR893_12850, partial [Clostridia bacterium]
HLRAHAHRQIHQIKRGNRPGNKINPHGFSICGLQIAYTGKIAFSRKSVLTKKPFTLVRQ